MANRGKELGPNFIRRLARIMPWVEQRMDLPEPPGRRPPPAILPTDHFGKLDAALDYDDADGVTVSIWSGKPATDTTRNIDGVVASELLLTSGTLASGSGVLIRRIDGRWYVIAVKCQT